MAGKYWNATDTDGDCSRCGIAWTEEELAGDEKHECPPGFWKPLRGNMTKITKAGLEASMKGEIEYNRCEFFRSIDEAHAFQASVEFVNDSAVEVTGIVPCVNEKSECGYSVCMWEEDWDEEPQQVRLS